MAEIYQHDPHAAGDEAFEAGSYRHLVPGNRGRMLDPRRTPVRVLALDAERGLFEVEVEAFEDRGAHWWLPVEDVFRFQFEGGCAVLPEPAAGGLAQTAERLGQPMTVDADPAARERTLAAIEEQRRRIRSELAAEEALKAIDLDACIASRQGSPAAADALGRLLQHDGLADLDESFSSSYVSNPHSGEAAKGYAIVIAEMGLCPYVGTVVRDERLFSREATRERRRAHVVLRLAFNQELFTALGRPSVVLYRGFAIDAGGAQRRRPSPLLAATFSKDVAAALSESGPGDGVLASQSVPASRLFMTFLETPAMSARYKEAEAVLVGEPGNAVF